MATTQQDNSLPPDVAQAIQQHAENNGWIAPAPAPQPLPPDVAQAIQQHAENNGWIAPAPAPQPLPPDVASAITQHAAKNGWIAPTPAPAAAQPGLLSPSVMRYSDLAQQAGQQYGVPPKLLLAVMQHESGGNPNSRSATLSATGLMQFLAATARQYGVNPTDPTSSINGAAHYLSDLYKQTGSWHGAVRGYRGVDDEPYINGVIGMAGLNAPQQVAGRRSSAPQQFITRAKSAIANQPNPLVEGLKTIPGSLAGESASQWYSEQHPATAAGKFFNEFAGGLASLPHGIASGIHEMGDVPLHLAEGLADKLVSGILTPATAAAEGQLNRNVGTSRAGTTAGLNPIVEKLAQVQMNESAAGSQRLAQAFGTPNPKTGADAPQGAIPVGSGVAKSLASIKDVGLWKSHPGAQTFNLLQWVVPELAGRLGHARIAPAQAVVDAAADTADKAGMPGYAETIRQAAAKAKPASMPWADSSPTGTGKVRPVVAGAKPGSMPWADSAPTGEGKAVPAAAADPEAALISHAKFAASDGKPVAIENTTDIANAIAEHSNIPFEHITAIKSVIDSVVNNLAARHGETPEQFISSRLSAIVPGDPIAGRDPIGNAAAAAINTAVESAPASHFAPSSASNPVTGTVSAPYIEAENLRPSPGVAPAPVVPHAGTSPGAVIPESQFGHHDTIHTPLNTPVSIHYAVVPLDSLRTSHTDDFTENPAYDPSLQPRDRTRVASRLQVNHIAADLNPSRLGASPTTSDGAPIIGADGQVESGNGRTMGIRKSYNSGSAAGTVYSQWVKDNASKFGIDPDVVSGIDRPVLVRVREAAPGETPSARADIADEMGCSNIAAMSEPEVAAQDARRLSASGALDALVGGDDLGAATNREFIRRFNAALPENERGGVLQDGDQSLCKRLSSRS